MKIQTINTFCRLKLTSLASCLLAVLFVTGCASTQITDHTEIVTGPIAKPGNIWVYAFAATPADVPANSSLAGQPDLDPTTQTDEQIARGRKVGAEIASELVAQIRGMGMPAQVASAETQPQLNDIVIRGYLLSVKGGNAQQRVAIGFSAGASEMKTAVEGFQMTANGLRKIASGNVISGSDKAPGAGFGVVGLLATGNPAGLIISGGMKVYGEESGSSTTEGRVQQTVKEISDQLRVRFQEQGWIN